MRENERQIQREQEREYEEALAEDLKREEQKKEDEMKKAMEFSLEEERIFNLNQLKHHFSDPVDGIGCKIRFNFPTGLKIEHQFSQNETLEVC